MRWLTSALQSANTEPRKGEYVPARAGVHGNGCGEKFKPRQRELLIEYHGPTFPDGVAFRIGTGVDALSWNYSQAEKFCSDKIREISAALVVSGAPPDAAIRRRA